MRTAIVHVRTDKEVKEGAEAVLSRLGIGMSAAVNLFLRAVVSYQGIPFDVRIPNAETLKAMEDVDQRRNLENAATVDELFRKIGVK